MEVGIKASAASSSFLGFNHSRSYHRNNNCKLILCVKQAVNEVPRFPHGTPSPSFIIRNPTCSTPPIEKQRRCLASACLVLSGAEDVEVNSSTFEDFEVIVSSTSEAGELKISIKVSGGRTREIFDSVFNKMVAAAQPIPGFRRVKGGKTPDVPRDVLLEILGASKVYKQVIKKVINSTTAEYVEKECLKVSKDMRVEQSFEELEDAFEPGETFRFDAILQLQE